MLSPMRRVAVLYALLVVTVAACSKRVSPIVAPTSTARPGAAPAGWGGGTPQTARVRLRLVGSVVSLDANFRPRLDRIVEYFVDSIDDPTAVPLLLDTLPVGVQLKQVRWRRADGTGFVVDNAPDYFLQGDLSPSPPPDGVLPARGSGPRAPSS